jgi:hypothetical protein
MKALVDEADKEEEKADSDLMKKIEKMSFIKRLSPYNKPCGNVVTGIMFSCV